MKASLRPFIFLLCGGMCLATALDDTSATSNDAHAFIENMKGKWFTVDKSGNAQTGFADEIQEHYPFGRSWKANDEVVFKAPPASKDLSISNKHIIFEGNKLSVQWFYHATDVKTGAKQIEATLAFGIIKNEKIISWTEYFDDSVGEMEMAGKMGYYDYKADEEPYPWPLKAGLSKPYRP